MHHTMKISASKITKFNKVVSEFSNSLQHKTHIEYFHHLFL